MIRTYKNYLIDSYKGHYVIVDQETGEAIAHADTVEEAKAEIDNMESEEA